MTLSKMSNLNAYSKKDFLSFFFQSKDVIRLDTFRMLLGITMLLYMCERWFYASEWLTAEGFHVSISNLSYHPFTVPLLSQEILPLFAFFLFGSIIAIIIGWQLQWTIWVALASIAYVTFADQYSAFTVNKLFIVSLCVLGLARRGPHWSIRSTNEPHQSIWPVRILQLSFIIHYFTAGWSKAVYGDWLTNPFVLYTQLQGIYRTEFAAWLYQIGSPNMWVIMQYSGLGFELLAPILFILKSTRRIAFIWGLSFQLVLALSMHQLIYFMLMMSCFYVLFVEDQTLHRWKNAFKRR